MKLKGSSVSAAGAVVVATDRPVLRSGQARIKSSGLFSSRGWKLKSLALTDNALVTPDDKMPLAHITKVERVDLTPHCLLLQVSDSRRWYLSFQTDRELYEWHDDVYSRCPKIGATAGSPFGFVHSMHVGLEPGSGNFTGLPAHWYESLGISSNEPKSAPVVLPGGGAIAAVTNLSSRRTSVSSVSHSVLSPPPGRTYKRISAQSAPAFMEGTVGHKKDSLFTWRWSSRYGVLGPETLTISKSKASTPNLVLRMNDVTQLERSTDRPHSLYIRLKSGQVHLLSFSSDREVHAWQDALYSRSPLAGAMVGTPKDFAHRVHVGIDPQTGEFTGLPENWQTVMLNLNVT